MTRTDLATWVNARGGAAHSTDARAAGYTTHALRAAVAAQQLQWVRRSWLVSPICSDALRTTVELGGRLTCVTLASANGLWVPRESAPHVAVSAGASRLNPGEARLHWARPPEPVARHAVIDTMINALFHVARCQAPADALAIWESAIRTRSADLDVLRRVAWGSSRAQELVTLASELSDSGLETRLCILLRSIGVGFRQQVVIDGHPLDALVSQHLVIQVDGFSHHQAADRRRDLRADARLALRGYTVLRFDWKQVLFHPDEVIAAIATAIAQGAHL